MEPQGDSGEKMNMSPHTVDNYRPHTETEYSMWHKILYT